MNLEKYAKALGIREALLTVVGEGANGIVLTDGSGLAYKFPKHDLGIHKLKHEIKITGGIAASLSVQVPEYTLVELDRPLGEAYCVYRLLPGEKLTPDIYRRNRKAMSVQLLRVMDEIHRMVPKDSYDKGMDYEAMYQEIQMLLFPYANDSQKREITFRFESYLRNADHTTDICVVHGDLGGSNILCDRASGNITGIIDWAEVAVDDPAVDYSALTCGMSIPGCLDDLLALRPSLAAVMKRSCFIQYTFPLQEALQGVKTQDEEALWSGLSAVGNSR